MICPHTATAVYAREFLPSDQHYIIVATAHPAKFEQVIEPIVGEKIPVPQSLQTLLNQQQSNVGIAPTVGAITELYQAYFNLSST